MRTNSHGAYITLCTIGGVVAEDWCVRTVVYSVSTVDCTIDELKKI